MLRLYQRACGRLTHSTPPLTSLFHSNTLQRTPLHAFSTSASSDSASSRPDPLNLVILGSPGVGKGTYAKYITEWMHLLHVSVGDLVRDELNKPTSALYRFRTDVAQGRLLPDEAVAAMLQQRFSTWQQERVGLLIDGYPRNVEQVYQLDNMCGKGYNLASIFEDGYRMPAMLPSKSDTCDRCAHVGLVQRADDVEETIVSRLELYQRTTAPVIDVYRERGELVEVQLTSGVEDMLPVLRAACLKQGWLT